MRRDANLAVFLCTSLFRALLRRLTTFIVWAGRYPVALNEAQSSESRSLWSTDYENIVALAGRLVREHQRAPTGAPRACTPVTGAKRRAGPSSSALGKPGGH